MKHNTKNINFSILFESSTVSAIYKIASVYMYEHAMFSYMYTVFLPVVS